MIRKQNIVCHYCVKIKGIKRPTFWLSATASTSHQWSLLISFSFFLYYVQIKRGKIIRHLVVKFWYLFIESCGSDQPRGKVSFPTPSKVPKTYGGPCQCVWYWYTAHQKVGVWPTGYCAQFNDVYRPHALVPIKCESNHKLIFWLVIHPLWATSFMNCH